jgi:predicted ATPase
MLLQEFVKPKILLIDDMESHMNPSLMMHAASWFGEILEKGSKIVISTHSLEAAKFIAGALEEHESQITLLALRDGILSSKNLSLDEVEDLEKAGIDVRVSGGILL